VGKPHEISREKEIKTPGRENVMSEPYGLRHLFQRMQVLDAGCGPDMKGDIRLDIVRTEATNIIADVHRLPFKDGSVWLVRSAHCLEHCDNPLRVVSEFVRVAQRYVCLTVPYTLDLDETQHIYSWTKASLTHFLQRFPFIDIAIIGNNRFSDGSFWGRTGQITKMIYKGVAVMLNIPMEWNATCTLTETKAGYEVWKRIKEP